MNKSIYESSVLEDIFDLILVSEDPWPIYFELDQKINFIENLIQKFADLEDYEKCEILSDIKSNMKL